MRVLLLGGGGREHALGWKLAQGPSLSSLTCAPGNPGLARIAATEPEVDPTDPEQVVALAGRIDADLVVVGPEAPLAAGVTDALRAAGVRVFGPSRSGARLESSKAFAKSVMERSGVPTAAAWVFDDRAAALAHVASHPGPYVVKADGLAAGKGVLVTGDRAAAADWVEGCFTGAFGEAGRRVVIEECLAGAEVSVFAICDGSRAVPLAPARDYKRLLDGDAGPNTGGMGSYSPVDDLPDGLVEWTMQRVVEPVLATMAADGDPYVGFLYVGLMLTPDGPLVLEFNCRLGDPETQVVLPRLQEDLVTLLAAAADGALPDRRLTWAPSAAVNVVLAAAGYPTDPRRGDPITGLDRDRQDTLIFHAGTTVDDGVTRTAGGRVLNVVGLAPDVAGARAIAYAAAQEIDFPDKQYRTDIAGAS